MQVTAACHSDEVSLHNALWLPCWRSSTLHNTTEYLMLHLFPSLCCYIFLQYFSRASCGRLEILDTNAASHCQPAIRLCRWWHADRDTLIEWKNCWEIQKTQTDRQFEFAYRLCHHHKEISYRAWTAQYVRDTQRVTHGITVVSWHDRQVLNMDGKHWLKSAIAALWAKVS